MIATFKDLLAYQAKHRLRSMTDLILFMVMEKKSTRVQIFKSITDFFIAASSTYEDIEEQDVDFRVDFIMDQLPTMIHVTDTAFKNIKARAPSIYTIEQAIGASMLTY